MIFTLLFTAAIAGWIAERLSGSQHNIFTNIFYGLFGAAVGNHLFGPAGFWITVLTSTVGALILIYAIRHIKRTWH